MVIIIFQNHMVMDKIATSLLEIMGPAFCGMMNKLCFRGFWCNIQRLNEINWCILWNCYARKTDDDRKWIKERGSSQVTESLSVAQVWKWYSTMAPTEFKQRCEAGPKIYCCTWTEVSWQSQKMVLPLWPKDGGRRYLTEMCSTSRKQQEMDPHHPKNCD